MTSSRFQPFIAMSLLAMTLLVVFSSAGSLAPVMSERFLELVIYALLTAFALALSVPLTHGELSVAHAIGMMAFLSLEASTYPAMSIAIFSGGILGAAALIVRGRDPDGRRRTLPELRQGVYLSARVTLSFYAAARIYAEVLQGPLPLSAPGRDNLLELSAPLALYALIYTIVYLAIYVLQLNSEHIPWQTQLRENGLSILIILLLPVPFALIGADVARADESIIYFTITIVGAVLIISGLYALSHSQERMRRQVIELQSLSVATGMMRGSLDLDSLLKTLYVQISELLDTRSATLALRGSPLTIALVMRQGVEQSPALPPDDVALLQQVLAGGRPLRLDTDSGAALPAGMMSWLGVPLTGSGAQVNGVVAVQSYDSARIFTENDLRLLNIVATSASIAIENARLYTEKSSRAEQLATLNQIAALLTGTLSPGEVLDTIVSSASTISDATGIAVYLYDTAEPPQLQLVRSAGIPADMLPHLAQPLLAARLVPGQRPGPLLISDLAADAETAQLRPALLAQGWQALVELPLTIGDLLPGFIAFFFFTGQPGLREDLDLFQAYATQAAQAIKNARTYETADKALEQRLEQLNVLAAMGSILNATMDETQIYDIILRYAVASSAASSGLALRVAAAGPVSIIARAGTAAAPTDLDGLRRHFLQPVVQSGQLFRSDDVLRLAPPPAPGTLPPHTRSLLITPIMARGGDVTGVILLAGHEVAVFGAGDGHFVAQMAYQAMIAAENTRLFQNVRTARDNLQMILNTMEEATLLINAGGEVAMVNPGIHLIGLTPEALLHRQVEDLLNDPALKFGLRTGLSSELLIAILQDIGTPGATGSYPPYSYEVHDEQVGVRYILRQIIPLRRDDQRGALLVFYNRTDERELERARESFTQMIVHDLRSPLTAVTTSLKLLREYVPDGTDYKPLVEKTTEVSRRAIRKVLTRVDSLLDIARMESNEIYLEREPVDLASLVEAVRGELEPLAVELEIAIVGDFAPHLPLLFVDGDKVERMLLNLVDNALKYSPAESTIRIQARLLDSGLMRVAVIDEGPGIPADYRQRLFDRFVQVEGRQVIRRGVGLGLAFCRLVAAAHGGSIHVEDNVPRGSQFVVTLPVVPRGGPTE